MAKILVVEDEDQIRKLLSAVLVRAGHEIATASDAPSALELCSPASRFDLVLTNANLPELDGHDLARAVAARSPATRVVLISEADSGCELCPFSPRCAMIRKPFEPKHVVETISQVLTQAPRLSCRAADRLLDAYTAARDAFHNLRNPGIDASGTDPQAPALLEKKEAAFAAVLGARTQYWAHLHEHGCRDSQPLVDSHHELERQLHTEMMSARAAFDRSCEKLSRLMALSSEQAVTREALHELDEMLRTQRAAHQVYVSMVQRFSDFLTGGAVFQRSDRESS